jgi:hypothetical protein
MIIVMNNFPKFLILFFSLCWNFLANAQVSVNLSQLSGTKWKFVNLQYDGLFNNEDNCEDTDTFWEFSNTKVNQTVHYDGRTFTHTFPFYISTTSPASVDDFNNSLVGKYNKGDYLVIYKPLLKRTYWYRIKSFDKKTGDMYLFRAKVPDEIGGRDVTIHLKLIK